MYDVAAHFQIDDVTQLLQWPNRKLARWLAYFELRPPVGDRLDLLLPKLFASMMNMWKSEGSPPITTDELRIDWTAPVDQSPVVENYTEATQASEAEMARGIVAAFGG